MVRKTRSYKNSNFKNKSKSKINGGKPPRFQCGDGGVIEIATLMDPANTVTHMIPVVFCPEASLVSTSTGLWRFNHYALNANTVDVSLEWHMEPYNSFAFDPKEPYYAIGMNNNTVEVFHMSIRPDRRQFSRFLQVELRGHIGAIKSIAFLKPSYSLPILATASVDRTVKLWQISNNYSSATCVATLDGHTESVNSVTFHQNSKLLATGSTDCTVRVYSWVQHHMNDRFEAFHWVTLVGHQGSVNSVAFHPKQDMLVTGSNDNTAKLWQLTSHKSAVTCIATLTGHIGAVMSVAFHPTVPLLATGSSDTTVKLWRFSPDGSNVTCVANLTGHSRSINSVAFHASAPLLAVGIDDYTAKLYNIKSLI